ncbi:MAG TPA: hypothetical protein VJB57_15635 [Dehalococcoidia bacterium]|nr:hypothetical protein [Dehalococcoidia bacterium]
MSLELSAKVTLGNLVFGSHSPDIAVNLSVLPGVNSFTVRLPAGVKLEAAPGDPAVLQLENGDQAPEGGLGALAGAAASALGGGAAGALGALGSALGGSGSSAPPGTVITGKLTSIHRSVSGTQVTAADGGADLGGFRPANTFERQSGADVIKNLAAEVGIEIDTVDLDLPLAAYVAHQGRTAAEHIAYLARLSGAWATFNAGGALAVRAWPEDEAELALLYGREIVSYEVRERPGPQAERVGIGNGPAGSPDAGNALRFDKEALPGGAKAPGTGAIWQASPILRTPKAATTASQAANGEAASGATRIYARCFLLPALRPGMVVEVQELPGGLSSGPWALARVTHRLKPELGGVTTFEGWAAGKAGGGGDLLGSALAAIGGLL